jgi:acetyl esterase/lipase
MSKYSCFYECWQTLARVVAHQGVVVVMPDFRNSVVPSNKGDTVAKFPGGLNDCVSAVHWAHQHAEIFGIDRNRVIIAGESGGGNLCIATALRLKLEGNIELIKAFYVMCPYLAGVLPNKDKYPSHAENAGIFLDYPDNQGQFTVTKYGEGLHEAENILAWPAYCTPDDLEGLPPCTVIVNEFDPFRDEGIEFYRKCISARVISQCRVLLGTIHGIGSYLPGICPEITLSLAKDMAATATTSTNAAPRAHAPRAALPSAAPRAHAPKRARL